MSWDEKCAKTYRPVRNAEAYSNVCGKTTPSLSHRAANFDKYQQNKTKHPALKIVHAEAEIYMPFASAIFVPSHLEAFSGLEFIVNL